MMRERERIYVLYRGEKERKKVMHVRSERKRQHVYIGERKKKSKQ